MPPDSGPTLKVQRSVSNWTSVTCSGIRTCAHLKDTYYVNMGPVKPAIHSKYPKCSGRVDNNFCNDKEEGYTCYESIKSPTWSDVLGSWNNNNYGPTCSYEYKYDCKIMCPADMVQGEGTRDIVRPCDRTLWKGTMNMKFNLVTCVVNNA